VKAARAIPWGAKAVFVEDWILDRGPEGAWISAAHLAERLGMSTRNVELHRRRLRELGFYVVIPRHGGRTDGWIPTLPLGAQIHGVRPADVADAATRIDALLAGTLEALSSRRSRVRSEPEVHDAMNTKPASPRTRSPLRAEREADFAPPARSVPLIQHLSEGQTLALPEDRTRVSAHALEAEQEGQTPPASEERPAAQVEADGWNDLRERLAAKRRALGQ
jgi:hypothetical protein